MADYMKAGCFGVGMSDFGEDTPADWARFERKPMGLEMHNLYTFLYQKATYEAVAENSDTERSSMRVPVLPVCSDFPTCWSADPAVRNGRKSH